MTTTEAIGFVARKALRIAPTKGQMEAVVRNDVVRALSERGLPILYSAAHLLHAMTFIVKKRRAYEMLL